MFCLLAGLVSCWRRVADNAWVHRLLRGALVKLYVRLRGAAGGWRWRWRGTSGWQTVWRRTDRRVPHDCQSSQRHVRQRRHRRVPRILGVLSTNAWDARADMTGQRHLTCPNITRHDGPSWRLWYDRPSCRALVTTRHEGPTLGFVLQLFAGRMPFLAPNQC